MSFNLKAELGKIVESEKKLLHSGLCLCIEASGVERQYFNRNAEFPLELTVPCRTVKNDQVFTVSRRFRQSGYDMATGNHIYTEIVD